MRIYLILLFSSLLFPFNSNATEHTISVQINNHSSQEESLGYGVIYQYKFVENFEFEAKYNQSGDLKIVEQERTLLGDYSAFSSGINFIKPHQQNLSIKLGFGVNVITASSSLLLVEENTVAPYFQIAAKYKFTDQLSLTLGHSSQFNNDALGTNHSLFLSFNWLFSQDSNGFSSQTLKTKQNAPVLTPLKNKHAILQQSSSKEEQNIERPIIAPRPLASAWYVQLGAYQKKENAQKKQMALKESYPLTLTTTFHNKFYRLLSQPFVSKELAQQHLLYLQEKFDLSGYVNKI